MSPNARVKKENALRKHVAKIETTHDVVLPFYPNECSVCKSTNQVKRCSQCNMVSYCSSDHQKEHWPRHREICNAIASILNEKGVSHVYENLRGVHSSKWRQAKVIMMSVIAKKLSRPMTVEDVDILAFPRVCFVCYDANQEKLQNCPDCPFASFCEEHPSSSLHDEDCFKIRDFQDQDVSRIKNFNSKLELATFKKIVEGTPLCENLTPPSSMTEYFEDYIKLPLKLYKELKIHISSYLSAPLSIFNAIQQMNLEIDSTLVLHLIDSPLSPTDSKPWEILLHLLPTLQNLKIVLVNSEFCPCCTSRRTEITVCKDCKFQNKTVLVDVVNLSTYADYKNYRYYQEPDMLVNFDLTITSRVESKKGVESSLDWKKLSCPIVFLSSTEIKASLITSMFQSDSEYSQVYYSGRNNFQSLKFSRNFKSTCVDLQNQFMIVFKRLPKMIISKNCFYPNVCPICSSEALMACEFCKMIFYCGFEHLKEHQPLHKEFCDAVKSLLTETGASNPFDNLDKGDPESWLRAKINLMSKVQVKLGKERQLMKCEEQMFLYTKTCLVCHSSDLSNLKTCECGISLCEKHKDNSRHQQLCRDLMLSLKLSTTMIRVDLDVLVKQSIREKTDVLPSPMNSFIDSCLSLNKEASEGKNKPNTPDIQKIMISDRLSRPLTFLYALQKLNFQVEETMIIHVIGAMGTDYSDTNYWDFVLYWLRTLKILKIIFIGPEMSPVNGIDISSRLKYMKMSKSRNYFGSFGVEVKQERYEDYFQNPSFEKPDIILGYDLDIQEIYGISKNSECTWKDTIITLAKVEVPFVLTAGTKEQALRDHKKICSVLGRSINFAIFEQNPFASLFPRRDVLFQSLRHSNDYIIIYTNWSQSLIKKPKLKNSEEEMKLATSAKFEINKSKTKETSVKNPEANKLTTAVSVKVPQVESKRRANLESRLKPPASKKLNIDTGFKIKPSQFETIPRDAKPAVPAGLKNVGCEMKRTEDLELNLKAEETDEPSDETEWHLVKISHKKEMVHKKELLNLVKTGQVKKKVLRIVAPKSKTSQVVTLKHGTKLTNAKNVKVDQNKTKLANGKTQGTRNRKEMKPVSVQNPGPIRKLLQNAKHNSKLEAPKLQKKIISGIEKLSDSEKKSTKEKVNKKELSGIEKTEEESKRFLGKFATKPNPYEIQNIELETKPENAKNSEINQIVTKLSDIENTRHAIANLIKKQTNKENVRLETIFRGNFKPEPKAAATKILNNKETNLVKDMDKKKNVQTTESSKAGKTDQKIKQVAFEKIEPKMQSEIKDMELKTQPTNVTTVKTRLADLKNSETKKAEHESINEKAHLPEAKFTENTDGKIKPREQSNTKAMSNLIDKSENKLQSTIFSAIGNMGYENEEYDLEIVEYKPKSVLIEDYKSEMNSLVKKMESKANLDHRIEVTNFKMKRTADKGTLGVQTRRAANSELKSNTDVESNLVETPNKKEKLLQTESSDVDKIGHETEHLENYKFNLELENEGMETNTNLSSTTDSTFSMEIVNSKTKQNGKENHESDVKLTENLDSKSKLGASDKSRKETNLNLITKASDNEKCLYKAESSDSGCIDGRKLSQTEIILNKTFTIHNFESSSSIVMTNSESQPDRLETGCVARITEIFRSLFLLFTLICIWILMHLKLKYEDFIESFINQKEELDIENFDLEIEARVESIESIVKLKSTQNSSSGEFEVSPLNFQNGFLDTKLGDSVKCKEQVRANKSLNFKTKSKLPEEKFLCRETHELLMEKLLLEEEMNHLANEKLYLQQECERVERENVLINDIRRQINDGITAVFQDED